MNVSDAIHLKRVLHKFTDEPLPEEMILTILNAGWPVRCSKNTQPGLFVTITDKAILNHLLSAVSERVCGWV